MTDQPYRDGTASGEPTAGDKLPGRLPDAAGPETIRPGGGTGTAPLSFGQERLWFLHQFEPEGVEYTTSIGLRLRGELDRSALRTALGGLVARHEPLRTTFVSEDGVARQVVHPARTPDTAEADLAALPAADREAALSRLLSEELATPFDLARGPVLRVLLARLGAEDHALFLNMHHIAADGWSKTLLVSELGELYDAAVEGRGHRLDALPVSYRDYAVQQRERCTEETLAGQLEYWRRELADLAPLDLPTDRPRPAVRTTAGATHAFRVPAEVATALAALGRERGGTLFSVLAASTQVMLARHTGQRDLALGTVSLGRDRSELERLVGFFVNTLVLRSRIDLDEPFHDLLDRSTDQLWDVLSNQDIPFHRLVDVLQTERDPSRTPLVQAALVLQEAPEGTSGFRGLRVEEFRAPSVSSIFDLTVEFTPERDGSLAGSVEYNTDLFDATTVERLCDRFRLLLSGIAEDAGRPVGDLPLLTAGEHTDVTRAWAENRVAYPTDRTVHDLVAEQCARTPDAVAVQGGGRDLTYRELEEGANRLARLLLRRGAGNGAHVAVCLPRGSELVVALLAVLKAGGTYVPVDPDYPAERVEFMLRDTGAVLCLTDRALLARLPRTDVPALCPADEEAALAALPADAPHTEAGPHSAAYVIYTSGSTGRPKGVVVEHRSIVRLVCDTDYVSLRADDVVAQAADATFDAATFEIWAPLVTGARIAVVPKDVLLDPRSLERTLREGAITTMFLTTAVFNQVVDVAPTAFAGLRHLLFGGEACNPRRVAQLLAGSPPERLVHVYGPTETTTFATAHLVREADGGTPVPIGGPIANTSAYVLDERRRPVPPGTPGELWIGGPGVARGYHGRPDLTEERFRPAPFPAEPGERMYRTGDLVRHRPSGAIEFVGRVDSQIKVRGYRIEPGEVEAVLEAHPAVTAAFVTALADGDHKRLVGYVRTEPDATVDGAELRAFTEERLPAHSVPSAFVTLEAFPLTANGKVDRRALPAPEATAGERKEQEVPRGAAQEALARVWSEVLGVRDIGATDNFFELGGDSILSIQVVARARRTGFAITSKDVFACQSLAELARAAQPVGTDRPSRDDTPDGTPAPLTPVQEWFFDHHTRRPQHFNQSALLTLAADVDEQALAQAVRALVRHHEALRTKFVTGPDGRRAQLVLDTADDAPAVEVERITLEHPDPAERDAALRALAEAAQAALDPAEGRLLRCLLFDAGPGEPGRLLLTAHHLAVDGVSWRILLEDLERSYECALCGADPDLQTVGTSYRGWARDLAAFTRSGGFDGQLGHWSERVPTEAATLPTDREGRNTFAVTRTVTTGLGAEDTRRLLQDVPAIHRTRIDDILLTALGHALARFTGRADTLVTLEGHGREEVLDGVDLSRTVGWFTSLYPVLLTAPAGRPVGDLLRDTKERLRGVPQRGIGHGALRHLGSPDPRARALAEAPHPQVSFNYLGQWSDIGADSALYRSCEFDYGTDHSPEEERPHLLDVVGEVRDGVLSFEFHYSTERYDRATVQGLADDFTTALEETVAHCLRSGSSGATPADFPLVRLDRATVDRLVPAGSAVEDIQPLTPMQSGMLFHSLNQPSAGAYSDHVGFVLEGAGDLDALAAAWQHVVDRTPVLRTRLVWEDVPEPVQVVERRATLRVRRLDWSGVPAAEQERRMRALIDTERAAGIDLTEAPLMRLVLIRAGRDTARVLWTFHHVVLDGWSSSHLFADVFAAYRSFADGHGAPSALPDRRPFRDYVAWLGRQDADAARAHWRTALAGLSGPTPLPYGRSVPEGHEPQASGQVRVGLCESETEALVAMARGHRITLNTAVQGAWAVLLARHAGARDVCFGATVAGRPADLPGAESMVGNFLNTLPVRVDVDDSAPLVDWLRRLQEGQAQARAFEYASLADIQRSADIPRGTALFHTLVVFENYPGNDEAAQRHGLWMRDVTAVDTTSFPLDLTAYDDDGELTLLLSYDPALYDRSQADALAEQLAVLLGSMATTPDQRVADLPMLSLRERDRVVYEWNDTKVPGEDACLHELVAEQARRTPDAVAVVYEDEELGYGELEARANRLAQYLVGQGVGPETVVGVCLERGPDMVTAALGVMKAGGAFLPLDPVHPADRIRLVLDDSAAAMLLTQSHLADRLPPCDATVVCLDTDRAEIGSWPAHAPGTQVGPDNLAYVIYTSGSTGTPKGVTVEHRSVVRAVAAWREVYGLDDGPVRQLSLASMAFDVFVSDLGHTLCQGGTLVLCPQEVRTDPARLLDLMERRHITHVETVPALAGALADEARRAGRTLPPLRVLAVGSDTWRTEDCRRLLDVVSPGTTVLNSYGVTEATVESSVFRVTARSLPPVPSVPIGRPVPGTRMYVLDDRREPVPAGVVGELYLGGTGVVRGYLNRPGLTEERFVPDLFAPGTDHRLYRTGDRARFLPDGNVEFLGRDDDQVKIRGFRVEPAEVESALLRHPQVAQAVAAVRGEPAVLTGYVVAEPGTEPEPGELRRFVETVLPRHMVPQAFVRLGRLPLNANGKVDRRALPAPAPGPGGTAPAPSAAPRTPQEAALAGLWAEVFGLGAVGVDDNFFDLGGDSILSIQVVSRARQLGLRLTAQDIFTHQTIAGIAAAVTAHDPEEQADVRTGPVTGRAPLTPIQRAFFQHHLIAPQHSTLSVLAQLDELPDEAHLRAALDALLDHHDALRARFTSSYGRRQQEIAPPGESWPLERLDLGSAADPDGALLRAAATAQAGLDLAEGPLVRALLVDRGGHGSPQLFLAAHHLVVDAVSWRTLLEDLETAYRQAAEGRPVDIGAKGTSFLEWSRRLSEFTAAGGFDEELDHWAAVGRRAEPDLPLDREGEATTASATAVRVELDEQHTDALLREVPGVYRTQVNDVLLTALAKVLADWTGRPAVLVDLEGHGREELFGDVDVSRTTGWFTTAFPVAVDTAAGPDWGALLRSVKEQLRTVPRRGIGYGALRHLSPAGAPAEVLAENPRARVSFNYLGRMTTDGPGTGLIRDTRLGFGSEQAPDERLEYLLDIVARVQDDRLEIELFHSTRTHTAETVRRLGEGMVAALREIVAHCRAAGSDASGATPSDFPLARIDQPALDALARRGRIADLYPVTPMQHGLLFHSLTEEGEGVYLGQLSFLLEGGVDADALAEAWQLLADRNPVLRTAFVREDSDEPLQLVRERVRVPVERLDFSELSETDREERLREYLAADRARGMDLAQAPLMRLALIAEPDGALRVVWTSHHLLLDGWSSAELVSEVLDHYRRLTGDDRPAPAVRRPFRDYVAWLREQDLDAAERYWRRLLDGFAAPTPLPADRTGDDAARAGTEATVSFQLSPEVTRRLGDVGRRHRLTANTIAQGAWALMLSRYSGERDVCFGSAVSGRPADLPGAETMVGLFINNLPVRVTVRPEQPLLDWLGDVQRHQVESRRYEYVSLAQIRGWAELPAGVDLFDSYVVFENYPYDGDMGTDQGIRVRDVRSQEPTSYAMVLAVFAGERLSFRLAYDPGLFDTSTAERVMDDLRTLLEEIAADPQRSPAALSALGAGHRERLLSGVNDTATELLSTEPVARQFARRAAETPDAVALVHGERRLTFAELDQRANRLAHHLAGLGTGPETPVAVCVERDPDLIVSLLAVLKAGGVYVPLDPAAPAERLRLLTEDTAPRVLVTQERVTAALPPLPDGTALVVLDRDADAVAAHPATAPETAVEPGHAAYVIHTSGSTGRPKGVVVEHHSLVNLLDSHRRTVFGPLREACSGRPVRVAHLAPATFDASWNPVLWMVDGHELHLVDESVRRDAHALVDYRERHRVDFLQTTPSWFRQLADAGVLDGGEHPLRGVALGGEAVGRELWELLRAREDLIAFNFYGPTEATVDALICRIADSPRPVLGTPVQNVRAYVLDPELNPAPLGAPGELFLAGDGLARGYLGRPDLNEQAFLAAPFDPAERLYRTGDRVRRAPDGRLEFLERLDDQMKLSGFRIEPGEITAALDGHEGVAESVVVVRGEGERARLVAYYRPVADRAPVEADLASHLAERLPAYLVPSAYVALDAFPLTRHGKVDRAALPDPAEARGTVEEWVAPRNETERLIARIWSETLGVDQVGAHDSFFALGGQSLTSVQAITRIKKTFGVRLPFRGLLENPTVAAAAQLVEDALLAELERMASDESATAAE